MTSPRDPHLPPKNLLSTSTLYPPHYEALFARAAELERGSAPNAAVRGRVLVNAFFENSTRTRLSFERAADILGLRTHLISQSGSSVAKGESLHDTVLTLAALGADALVLRHASSGAAAYAAGIFPGSVINAGDGQHEHPTQALLDAYTIRQRKGRLDGLTVAIIGDLRHSRVARSNIFALSTLGCQVRIAGPASLAPKGLALDGVKLAPTLEAALDGADVVMTLRIQAERLASSALVAEADYIRDWQITPERFARAAPDAILLHPGPMMRGVEIASAVADAPASCILDQVRNGVYIRAAVLENALLS